MEHYDDIVWQDAKGITCGKIKEAFDMAMDALKNPWHRVSEGLPKETCEVLICWETVNHERKWTQKVMFRRNAGNPEDCWFEDEDECRPTPDYWMYIPELPKED